MGVLYLVATPIGNLDDMPPRALRVLSSVGAIAAEDTRTLLRLLHHFQITPPARLLSYTEHNRRSRIPQILQLLAEQDLALVSEAGMPTISDPGQELVAAATAARYEVQAIPGPSALVAGLAVSGLPTRHFLYLGFLPRTARERRLLLESVVEQPWTLVIFESPRRVRQTLTELHAVLGDRRVAICRELTKLHEQTLRLRLSAATALQDQPRGEYTLVVDGAAEAPRPAGLTPESTAALRALRERGVPARDAIALLAAATGLPRRLLYDAWLSDEQDSDGQLPMLE